MLRLLILFLLVSVPLLPAHARTLIVISDTHFGVGHATPERKWHAYEDFRWQQDLEAFLVQIDKVGKGQVDLVLNGDTFELWQSALGLPDDCPKLQDANLGCTEEQALRRLKWILTEHAGEIAALKDFASKKENRLILVPGNHDAAILFPRLRAELVSTFSGAKYVFAEEGFWTTDDGKVLCEHGHQIGADVNRFPAWPKPFITEGKTVHLRRSGGEEFVQDFYNAYEEKYPIIDNITEESAGVKYALALEKNSGLAKAGIKFLKFLFLQTSWPQRGRWLGGDKPGQHPEWNLAAIKNWKAIQLAELLPDYDPFRDQVAAGQLEVSDFTDDELQEICDRAHAYAAAFKDSVKIGTCPGKLGSMGEAIFRSRNDVLSAYLLTRSKELQQAGRPAFTSFIYSHTHRAEEAFTPGKGPWSPHAINTGAWQRVITPWGLRALQKSKNLEAEKALGLKPEDLPACYSFVQVNDTAEAPVLSHFRKENNSKWVLRPGACP